VRQHDEHDGVDRHACDRFRPLSLHNGLRFSCGRARKADRRDRLLQPRVLQPRPKQFRHQVVSARIAQCESLCLLFLSLHSPSAAEGERCKKEGLLGIWPEGG
jgi:hypothetical protein